MTEQSSIFACIALGSNIEPRRDHLAAAISSLGATNGIKVVATSSWHETKPVRLPELRAGTFASEEGKYLNGACVVETLLTLAELLGVCLEIEQSRGRDRAKEGRWGARTLDLDLLLFGDQMIDEPGLSVPHPRMLERLFVLEPLAEVAGDWIVPGSNRSVRAHLIELRQRTTEN